MKKVKRKIKIIKCGLNGHTYVKKGILLNSGKSIMRCDCGKQVLK